MDDSNVNMPCEDGKLECPKEATLLALMEKTGYSMVQENGQRKYGGPPPGWRGPPPPRGCEVFVGKIPRDMYEDELVPLFECAGCIYEFRLMLEFSGKNRGYAFVMYTTREAAQQAIQLLNNHEIRPSKFIGVCVSVDNCRLFIGSIPKDMKKKDIQEEMMKVTEGVVDVIVHLSATDKNKNRGYAFVEYESHKAAAMARRKLMTGTFLLGDHTIQVSWAEPEKDIDDETMQHVRVLYVRNLMLHTTEDTLWAEFSRLKPGSVERVRKLTDYAFVHFSNREDALVAQQAMNGTLIDGSAVEVTLAKPASKDKTRRSKRIEKEVWGSDSSLFLQNRDDPGIHLHSEAMRSSLRSLWPAEFERHVYPLLPGTSLVPAYLQLLKPNHLGSAVSQLEYYCHKNGWSLPEYYLYSVSRPESVAMLIYKIVISSIRRSYMPDKICAVVEDAKEIAAQNALWKIDCSFSTPGSPGSFSPPVSPVPSLLPIACQPLPCLECPMAQVSPPLTVSGVDSQPIYISPPSPFF